MRKIILIGLFLLFLQAPCMAGDFVVEYVKENYRETRLPASYDPVIYHSIQVTSDAGPKLLILKGDDYHYRKWLRQYIAQGKQFIAQIPDDKDDLFISSRAFELDITDLHPVNLTLYRKGQEKARSNKSGLNLDADPFKPGGLDTGAAARKEKLALEKAAKEKKAGLKQKKTIDQAKEKAARKRLSKDKEKQALKKQQERARKQKQQEQLKNEQAEKLKQALERQQQEHENFLASLAQKRAAEEERRKQEMEQRWLELKARLLEDDRLRNMEIGERNREIQRRWQQLQLQYGFY